MHADGIWLELSGHVIGCAFSVLNPLGAGFSATIHGDASAYELRWAGQEINRAANGL